MIRLEVHPGDGGADAEAFATEFAAAVGRHAGVEPTRVGRVVLLHRL